MIQNQIKVIIEVSLIQNTYMRPILYFLVIETPNSQTEHTFIVNTGELQVQLFFILMNGFDLIEIHLKFNGNFLVLKSVVNPRGNLNE